MTSIEKRLAAFERIVARVRQRTWWTLQCHWPFKNAFTNGIIWLMAIFFCYFLYWFHLNQQKKWRWRKILASNQHSTVEGDCEIYNIYYMQRIQMRNLVMLLLVLCIGFIFPCFLICIDCIDLSSPSCFIHILKIMFHSFHFFLPYFHAGTQLVYSWDRRTSLL